MELNSWLKKKLSQGKFITFWPRFWAGLEFVNPSLREAQYLLTLDLDFFVHLPASDSWPLPFETHHFLPDNTAYDTESGSYLDSYSSFKQTRAPVVLMYWKKKYIIKLHVDLAAYNGRHGRLTTKTFALLIQVIWKCCVCLCDTLIRITNYTTNNQKQQQQVRIYRN